MTKPPIGILADIAAWQREQRRAGVTDPQLEPRLPKGCSYLGKRIERADHVLVWLSPDGAVIEQRLPLRRLPPNDQAIAEKRRREFRIVKA